MIEVLGIIVGKNGKTIGAKFNWNGEIKLLKTEDLKKCNEEVSNAIIDKNGFVKTKRGCKLIPRLSSDEVFGTKPNSPKILVNKRLSAIQQRDIMHTRKIVKGISLIYHGTKALGLVPKYGVGGRNNDYGSGFYLAEDLELAREWAYSKYAGLDQEKGYVYHYSLDFSKLRVLNLCELDNVHWVAELLSNRKITKSGFYDNSDVSRFVSKFKIDTSQYDVIIGYRADDAYFSYVQSFADGTLSLNGLETCMREGNLGLQVFIKSRKAFSMLKLVKREEVNNSYKGKFTKRTYNTSNMCKRIERDDRRNRSSNIYIDKLI